MKCSEIMQREVVTCRDSESASDCARVMRDQNIGFVPVVDGGGKVIGAVTDRDLVLRVLADGHTGSTTIRQVMSREIISCGPNDDLASCERKMADECKSRMLVIDGGHCVGVISLSDIAQAEEPIRSGEILKSLTQREQRAFA